MMAESQLNFFFSNETPVVTFGVLTDVQYADIQNRPAVDDSGTRYYRTSLNHVDKAFLNWKNSSVPVRFALHLGDIIDGINVKLSTSKSSLKKTLDHFERHSNIPTFPVIGNHELYNFSRRDVIKHFSSMIEQSIDEFKIASSFPLESKKNNNPALYYKFTPVQGIKFIALDCFDISMLGCEISHPNYIEAAEVLSNYHEDDDNLDSDANLIGLEKRFVKMNGALGNEQLRWLEEELIESEKHGEKVIVFGHLAVSPETCESTCLLWNYEELTHLFQKYSCVVAYLCGHAHKTGYAVDNHGIHYVVFAGIVEASPEEKAFSTISVYLNRLEIIGYGIEKSYTLPLRPTGILKQVEDDCNTPEVYNLCEDRVPVHSVKVTV